MLDDVNICSASEVTVLLVLSNICLGERLVFVMKQLPYVTSPNVIERAELYLKDTKQEQILALQLF